MKRILYFTKVLPLVLVAVLSGTVSAQTNVTFPDPNLEAAVREELNRPTGDLTTLDLQGLQSLFAVERGITNLSGLEWATNLEWLELSENRIGDVRVLGQLTSLVGLYIYDNPIEDLTPLLGLTGLQSLGLGGSSVRNYAPLGGLVSLESLYIGNTPLASLNFLASLTNLTMLSLSDNQIRDPTPLLALPNLRDLYLNNNPIKNPASLAGFTNLHSLSLGGPSIANLDWLADLKQLSSFSLSYSSPSNLGTLGELTNLTELILNNNRIADYTAVAGLTNLTSLLLADNTASNIDFVSGLRDLRSLCVNFVRMSDLKPIAGLTNLSGVWAPGNALTNIAALESLPKLADADLRINSLDLSPGSAAMQVITNLQSRGVRVEYLPQHEPPQVIIQTNWLIAANHTTWLPFWAHDVSFGDPLVFSACSSNTALISQVEVLPDPGQTLVSRLTVTPALNQTGETDIALTATDQNGVSTNVTIHVSVVMPTPFDGQVVNCPGLVWQTAGNPSWCGQTNQSHDGVAAAQSGAAGSWLETTVPGPGTFSFWYQSSSNSRWGGGLLTVSCAGSNLAGSIWLDHSSGWHREVISLPAGTWVLRWDTYLSPGPSTNSNTLWLDETSFVAGPPACWLELDPESKLGWFGLVLHGELGATCDLEISPDLQSWSPLTRLQFNGFSKRFGDTDFKPAARFYRLRKVE